MFGKIKVYYHFQLDLSSEENIRRINPEKAGRLEKELRKGKFEFLAFNIGTNGAYDSILIGVRESRSIKKVGKASNPLKFIFENSDLPYKYTGFYTKSNRIEHTKHK